MIKIYHGTSYKNALSILAMKKFIPGYKLYFNIYLHSEEPDYEKLRDILQNHVFFTTELNVVLEEYAVPSQHNPQCVIGIEVEESKLLPDLIDAPHVTTWQESVEYCGQVMVKGEVHFSEVIELWIVEYGIKPMKLDLKKI